VTDAQINDEVGDEDEIDLENKSKKSRDNKS